jgi:ATP-dependent Clp endopeptidase proteolytic subunit ClpP
MGINISKTEFVLPLKGVGAKKDEHKIVEQVDQLLPIPSEEDLLPSEFCLFLTGDITIDSATKLCEELYAINDVNLKLLKMRNIKLIINSPGGDLLAAQMICDVIEEIETDVHAYAYGHVCSAAFLVFMHGKRGHRYSSQHTQFMSHTYSMVLEGSFNDITKHRKAEFMRIHDRLLTQYSTHTGLSKKQVEEILLTNHDVWLNAKECKDLNIVDVIIGTKKQKLGENSGKRTIKKK